MDMHTLWEEAMTKEWPLLRAEAQAVRLKHFGRAVWVRALIEISAYCRRQCNYCGLRASNREAVRYRLSVDDILRCCDKAAAEGILTFVLQGGEDPQQDDTWIAEMVRRVNESFPQHTITLSVGERSEEAYRSFYEAGARRYLLRHETRDDAHYALLHPHASSGIQRRECLFTLQRIGYQTGAGMMIGAPGQTLAHLLQDLAFLDQLQPQMIGIGPFIPAAHTPYASHEAGSVELTLRMLATLRLAFPHVWLPATTALTTLRPTARLEALQCGANVVMPNFSPPHLQGQYSIYNNKHSEPLAQLSAQLDTIGYYIDYTH